MIGTGNLRRLAEVYGHESHFRLLKAKRVLLAIRKARVSAYSTHKMARELAVEYRSSGEPVGVVLEAAVKLATVEWPGEMSVD